MPLEFFRNADDRLLFDAVSAAFAADRERHEPGSREAAEAAQATVTAQGLIQPVNLPGRTDAGISLVEATAIIEAAGRSQLSFPLTESLVLATALAAIGHESVPAIANVAAKAEFATNCDGPEAGWRVRGGAVEDEWYPAKIQAPEDGKTIETGLDLRPLAWILIASDILGAAQSLFDRSMVYLGERQQFGQPLSSYQALRHRAADDWVLLEDMRASIDHAAALFDSGAETGTVLHAARIAKATASDGGPIIAENAIQYHGAVGFTWDFGLHFALKRIKRLSIVQGTASDHYRLIGERYLQGVARTFVNSGA